LNPRVKKYMMVIFIFLYLLCSFSDSNRPPWKCVRYSDFVEKPRLLISVLGEKKRQIEELKENLQSTIQKLVKKV
jgi:hypothetical protein